MVDRPLRSLVTVRPPLLRPDPPAGFAAITAITRLTGPLRAAPHALSAAAVTADLG